MTVGENIGKKVLRECKTGENILIPAKVTSFSDYGALLEIYGETDWHPVDQECYPIPDPDVIQPGEMVEVQDEQEWGSGWRYIGTVANRHWCYRAEDHRAFPWINIRRIPPKKSVREQAEAIMREEWVKNYDVSVSDCVRLAFDRIDAAGLLKEDETK